MRTCTARRRSGDNRKTLHLFPTKATADCSEIPILDELLPVIPPCGQFVFAFLWSYVTGGSNNPPQESRRGQGLGGVISERVTNSALLPRYLA